MYFCDRGIDFISLFQLDYGTFWGNVGVFFAVHFINMPVLNVSPVGSNSSYIHLRNVEFAASLHKGNNKITALRTILQRESQNS